ncbi:MAG: 4Fe-4S binding protein [Clostridia bacterium]|nr:4Fe-4S binding protein [Clostridia bacterium]
MSLTKEVIAHRKSCGFLRNRGTDSFSGRVVSAGGVYTAEDLIHIAECAKKYGNGKVCFTSRQSAEIVGIPIEATVEAADFLAAHGLYFGGTGARVRPITACKGTVCVFGNADTQALAKDLHERFYIGMAAVALPHKFKIGVGGCPNSCMKPSLNDVGIEARACFDIDPTKCRGCGSCAPRASCRSGAISFTDGHVKLDTSLCRKCGLCLGKCPFGAFPKQGEPRFLLTVGGTWGKKRRDGTPLSTLICASQIGDAVETVILWYRKNGYRGERLGETVDRLGIASLEAALLEDTLRHLRDEILAVPMAERPAL